MSILKRTLTSIAALGLLFALAISAAYAQQPQARPRQKKAHTEAKATDSNETYTVQTYEVGDLIINVQDHPYIDQLSREPLKAAGGLGGGGGGGVGGGGGQFSVPFGRDDQKQKRSAVSKAVPIMLCQFGGGGGGAARPRKKLLKATHRASRWMT